MIPFFPEDISVLALAQFVLLIVTPIVLVLSFRHNTKVNNLTMCHELGERHMELMWMTVENPSLNGVWDPLSRDRLDELRLAQRAQLWGAWKAMTPVERERYRFARRALEHVEQAHDAYKNGLMPLYIWQAWERRLAAWKSSSYSEFIMGDLSGFYASSLYHLMQDNAP